MLIVVLSHFAPDQAPGGFLGVDLFFVLSGFLITSLLVTEWESSGGIRLGQFWVRRARRLLPALLVVLGVVLLHGWLKTGQAERHQLGLDGLSSLFYVANWRFISSGQSYVMQFVRGAQPAAAHVVARHRGAVLPGVAPGGRRCGGRDPAVRSRSAPVAAPVAGSWCVGCSASPRPRG